MTATELFIYFYQNSSLKSKRYIHKALKRMGKKYLENELMKEVEKESGMATISHFTWSHFPLFNANPRDLKSVDKFLGAYNDSVYYLFDYFPIIHDVGVEKDIAEKEWKNFLRTKIRKNIYKRFTNRPGGWGGYNELTYTVLES